MMERTGRSLRRQCGGGLFRGKLKKRTVSLDETIKSLNSLPLSEASQTDLVETSTASQRQGALSKATAVLFRRHFTSDCIHDDKDAKEEAARVLQEEESTPSQPAPKDTAAGRRKAPAPTKSQDPAVRARKEAIRAQQRLLGKHHPDVLFSLECLMRFHRERGEYNEALIVFEEKQRLSRESYWNRSPRNEQGIPINIVVAHE